jgi:hypothetical protein
MTEYLSLLIKKDPADVQALVDLPFVESTGGLETSPGKKTSGKKEIDLVSSYYPEYKNCWDYVLSL